MINSGTCFRTPEPVLERWVAEHGIDWAATSTPTTPRPRRCSPCSAVDPERDGPQRPAAAGGRRGARRQPRAAAPQRRRLRAVQLVPDRLPAGRQAGDARHLPAARGRRRGAGSAPGSRRARADLRRRGAPRGRCRRGTGVPGDGDAGRSRSAPGTRVVLAGGAFGTPELLLRSGFRSPSGALGRNLRIHPACWVGARFEEEVRGWEGVMQSYAVDEWEDRGSCSRRRSRRSRSAASGSPAPAPSISERLLEFGNLASTGRPPLRQVRRAGRPRLRRLAADLLPAHPRGRRPARVRDRPRRGALLRGRGDARSIRRSPAFRRCREGGSPSSRPRPRAGASCGSRPFTRWAPRAWTPIRAGA